MQTQAHVPSYLDAVPAGADLYRKATTALDQIPMSVVLLAARLAVADVFWRSAQSKLASWPTTIQLFANEYKVPLLPPVAAAYLATATELTASVLLLLGFLSRAAALALIGLTAVIQLAVYPENWPDHILWASLLLLIVARGPGSVSLDRLLMHVVRQERVYG